MTGSPETESGHGKKPLLDHGSLELPLNGDRVLNCLVKMRSERGTIEFFLNKTNLTFLAFLYKIDIKGFQNEQKIKLPPVGIELITPTIYGLEF